MVFEEPDEVRGDAEGVHLLLVGRRHGPHEAQDCCHEQRIGSLRQLEESDCDQLPVRYPGRLHAVRFVSRVKDRRHGPHEAQNGCHEQRLGSLRQLEGSD